MEKGADITGKTKDYFHLVKWAKDNDINENKKLVMALIEMGKIDSRDYFKDKKLIKWATENGHVDIINQLAKYGGETQYGDTYWKMMTTGKLLAIMEFKEDNKKIMQKINEIAKALNISEMS